MPCQRVTVDGIVAVVCTRGRGRAVPVCACGAPAVALCDHRPRAEGRRCSRPLCQEHAIEVGPDEHVCATHPRQELLFPSGAPS